MVIHVETVPSRERLLQAVESVLDDVGDPPDLDEIRELVWMRSRLRARTRAAGPAESGAS